MDDLLRLVVEKPIRLNFGYRLLASILDLSIVLSISGIYFSFFISSDFFDDFSWDKYVRYYEPKLVYFVEMVGIPITLLEVVTGRTPAKYILGYAIGDLAGRKASRGALFKRGIVKIVITAAAVLAVIYDRYEPVQLLDMAATLVFAAGCLMAITSERMAAHDKLSRTAVYHAADLQALTTKVL